MFAWVYVILVSPPPLLLGSFIEKGQIRCCLQPGAYKGRFAGLGLVLDGSLGAGGTDEPFLYLRLTCKIRNIVYQTILLDLAVSLESVKQRIRIY